MSLFDVLTEQFDTLSLKKKVRRVLLIGIESAYNVLEENGSEVT